MNGKEIRLARLIRPQTGKACIVAIDHGITLGPIKGLKNAPAILTQLIQGHADIIILHKGLLKQVYRNPELACGRYIMHLSASTSLSRDQNEKVLVSSVEEAISMGADGVSIHVNIGTDSDISMIKDLGKISARCARWGMPLLAMMYSQKDGKNATQIAHAARLGEELGADIVKVNYPSESNGIAQVIAGVQIPVVIAGGPKADNPQSVLQMIHDAIAAGASGVSIGRNIFQHHQPKQFTNLISQLIHGEISLQECLKSEDTAPLFN